MTDNVKAMYVLFEYDYNKDSMAMKMPLGGDTI